MKLNIYLNNVFYRSMDLGEQELYDPRRITDLIVNEIKNETLNEKFHIEKGKHIRIERVD